MVGRCRVARDSLNWGAGEAEILPQKIDEALGHDLGGGEVGVLLEVLFVSQTDNGLSDVGRLESAELRLDFECQIIVASLKTSQSFQGCRLQSHRYQHAIAQTVEFIHSATERLGELAAVDSACTA